MNPGISPFVSEEPSMIRQVPSEGHTPETVTLAASPPASRVLPWHSHGTASPVPISHTSLGRMWLWGRQAPAYPMEPAARPCPCTSDSQNLLLQGSRPAPQCLSFSFHLGRGCLLALSPAENTWTEHHYGFVSRISSYTDTNSIPQGSRVCQVCLSVWLDTGPKLCLLLGSLP